ncbi:MAG: hypothetical protein ABSG97_08120 [Sedimentisphaerales bacterium]
MNFLIIAAKKPQITQMNTENLTQKRVKDTDQEPESQCLAKVANSNISTLPL